jgi:hypothetical protein
MLTVRNGRTYPDSFVPIEVRPVNKIRKEISLAAFNERMNRIAQALPAKGIRKDMKVAPLCNRQNRETEAQAILRPRRSEERDVMGGGL